MEEFPYTLVRSDRKTLSLQISPQGRITVRCPRRMAQSRIDGFLREKAPWIRARLQKIQDRPRLPVLTENQKQQLKDLARIVIPQRLNFFAPQIGVTYGRVSYRMQKTRWGSCSAEGNLNFNILLMLSPPEVIDYVVVHELCHRKEMNHSRAFWDQVQRILPDYKIRRKWLNENGSGLMVRGFGEEAL